MHSEYELSDKLSTIDWWRLANIMAAANLFDRKAFDIARAFHGSYASVFVHKGDELVAAARATSDGVYYATVFDVVVAREHQGGGVGRLLVVAVSNRDLAVVQCILLLVAATMVVSNLIVDFLYGFLDPRLRHAGGRSGS